MYLGLVYYLAFLCLLLGQLEVLCNNYKWNYNYNWRTQSHYRQNTNFKTNFNSVIKPVNTNTNTQLVRYTNVNTNRNTNGNRYTTNVIRYTTNNNGNVKTNTNTNHYITTVNNNRNVQNYQAYSYRFNFQDYEFTGLNYHNKYRSVHQAQGLTLDPALNERARNCAVYYASRGTIDHSCHQKDGAGENLFMILGSARSLGPGDAEATRRAVNAWYNEISLYKNYNNQFGMSHATGHFTQLVWQQSSKLGIGVATVRGKTCVVALYYPPGNYYGQFMNNVRPPAHG